jgi:hypothetical protein
MVEGVVYVVPDVINIWPDKAGSSAIVKALKVGWAAAPLAGPAKTVLAVWVFRVSVRVPLPVTGEPVIVKMGAVDPSASPTLDTVPGVGPEEAEVTRPLAFTVTVALVKVPGLLLAVANVSTALPGPVAVPSPVKAVI